MKKKKILAMLLSFLVLFSANSLTAFAGVEDVADKVTYDFSTTMAYDTTVKTTSKQVATDGTTVLKSMRDDAKTFDVDITDPAVQAYITAEYDAACDDCLWTVLTYVEPQNTLTSGQYTVKEASVTTYTSSQVKVNGEEFVTDDLDKLIKAYIDAGDISSTLHIIKHTVYTIDGIYCNDPQAVSTVKLKDATLSFAPGDVPKFTAKSAEPDLYYVYIEKWTEVGGDKYITSSDFFNRDKEELITQFEEGKEYAYSVWVKPYDVYTDGGEFLFYATTLSGCKNLVLNGTNITVPSEKLEDMEDAGIWLNNVASFTASKTEAPATTDPAPTAPATTVETKEPASPAVTNTTSPQTGDESPIALAFTLMAFASIYGIALTLRKKENK